MLKAVYLGGVPDVCNHCDKPLEVGASLCIMAVENSHGFGLATFHRECLIKMSGCCGDPKIMYGCQYNRICILCGEKTRYARRHDCPNNPF